MVTPALATRRAAALAAALLLVAGCGGGGSGSAADPTAADGTVYIGLTDADGDFLRYEVDVVAIRLRRADGTEVDALPAAARLDFAQYVDLTEFFSAATVPAGRYVAGELTLDYTDADVWVEVGGVATPADVRDPDGQPLGLYTLDVELAGDRPLVVRRGLPALLTVDFDLAASHQVDVGQAPPRVTAAPLLAADIEPVAEKELRARGPLVSVDAAASTYVVDLRPFHHRRAERFGEVTVHVADDTSFDVDGVHYAGAAGLAALAALPPGTPTTAFGTLDTETREFTAAIVRAGDSVPGVDADVVAGNVVRRQGDTLVVRGALVVPRAGEVRFHDDVEVTVGAATQVARRDGTGAVLGAEAISVGQRVEVFGTLAGAPGDATVALDADPGRVRLLPTRLGGTVMDAAGGALRLDLDTIDGRRIGIFDFAGTGAAPEVDADPADYEVETGALDLGNLAPGEPARVVGWVRPFGQAPADFAAAAVVDRADGPAALVLGWRPGGTVAPFASLGPAGLVPDLANPALGLRHHLVTGGAVVDLLDLPAAPLVGGAATGPARYAIATGRSVRMFSDFDAFAAALAAGLDGSRRALGLHAEGRYDAQGNALEARLVGVTLAPAE
jgi:hypothetical protein